jgi:hypothetical protein
MQAVRNAIRARDRKATEQAAQRLRNCLIAFGCPAVSGTAESLELAVQGERIRLVQREWKRLERQLQLLVPQVQRLMLEVATPKTAVQ